MNKPYLIDVKVRAQYLPERSEPESNQHAFSYTVTIRNIGAEAAQLISRHWVITDANGEVEEVRGLGVVGQQPLLQPGEGMEYTSGCVLPTPFGTMKGTYQMVTEDGTTFSAPIEEFSLSAPWAIH